MSLTAHLAASLQKKKQKKNPQKIRGFIDLDRGKRKALSAATQGKNIKGSEPQRSIAAAGNPLSRCPLCRARAN